MEIETKDPSNTLKTSQGELKDAQQSYWIDQLPDLNKPIQLNPTLSYNKDIHILFNKSPSNSISYFTNHTFQQYDLDNSTTTTHNLLKSDIKPFIFNKIYISRNSETVIITLEDSPSPKANQILSYNVRQNTFEDIFLKQNPLNIQNGRTSVKIQIGENSYFDKSIFYLTFRPNSRLFDSIWLYNINRKSKTLFHKFPVSPFNRPPVSGSLNLLQDAGVLALAKDDNTVTLFQIKTQKVLSVIHLDTLYSHFEANLVLKPFKNLDYVYCSYDHAVIGKLKTVLIDIKGRKAIYDNKLSQIKGIKYIGNNQDPNPEKNIPYRQRETAISKTDESLAKKNKMNPNFGKKINKTIVFEELNVWSENYMLDSRGNIYSFPEKKSKCKSPKYKIRQKIEQHQRKIEIINLKNKNLPVFKSYLPKTTKSRHSQQGIDPKSGDLVQHNFELIFLNDQAILSNHFWISHQKYNISKCCLIESNIIKVAILDQETFIDIQFQKIIFEKNLYRICFIEESFQGTKLRILGYNLNSDSNGDGESDDLYEEIKKVEDINFDMKNVDCQVSNGHDQGDQLAFNGGLSKISLLFIDKDYILLSIQGSKIFPENKKMRNISRSDNMEELTGDEELRLFYSYRDHNYRCINQYQMVGFLKIFGSGVGFGDSSRMEQEKEYESAFLQGVISEKHGDSIKLSLVNVDLISENLETSVLIEDIETSFYNKHCFGEGRYFLQKTEIFDLIYILDTQKMQILEYGLKKLDGCSLWMITPSQDGSFYAWFRKRMGRVMDEFRCYKIDSKCLNARELPKQLPLHSSYTIIGIKPWSIKVFGSNLWSIDKDDLLMYKYKSNEETASNIEGMDQGENELVQEREQQVNRIQLSEFSVDLINFEIFIREILQKIKNCQEKDSSLCWNSILRLMSLGNCTSSLINDVMKIGKSLKSAREYEKLELLKQMYPLEFKR